ncbi:MAG: DUF433 domain-containing protein [Acidobacteriota bacterium]|nr:DUF433 domain-containing protein [Acidobacteriota bacterium]
MPATATENPTVVRNDRGLSVKGTRLTLYQIMDYLVDGASREIILEDHPWLSAEQLDDVISYIETNRAEFEVEYQRVLKRAEETERYWRERNRERERQFDPGTLSPERRALWNKLQAWKEQINNGDQGVD